MAICTLPVFRGAGVRPRLSAQRPGLPSDAAALPEHGAPPEPHVPDHQCLLSGELSQPSLCVRNRASLQLWFLTQAVMCSLKVSLNAWFWSTVFHTRDTYLTEVKPTSVSDAILPYCFYFLFKEVLFFLKLFHSLLQVLMLLCVSC